MHNLSQRISTPKTLEKISQFNWNGIFTSAIDDILIRSLQSEWREVDPIYNKVRNPDDPRNRVKLHCTFLFGNVSRIDKDEVPPLKRSELTIRRQEAIHLLARLPSQITPLGALVIDAYDPNYDWLKIDDLIPVLAACLQNHIQVFLFSAVDEITQNEEIIEISKQGKIYFFNECLYEAFIHGEQENAIDLKSVPEDESINRFIEIKHKTLQIPPKLWNQVTESATIIDDSKLVPPLQISTDKLYREFRNFISNAESRLDWPGFLRGFAFDRDYENQLFLTVKCDISSKHLPENPIILSGQTGTGKTVALKHLAIKVRSEKEIPVLFIERKINLPKWEDIDVFCQWVEDNKAFTTLIIWDGMLTLDNYQSLFKYLTGRGRKVTLVGSYYRIDDEENNLKCRIINVPTVLQESEISPFLKYVEKFNPSFVSDIKTKEEFLFDESFLVALYRLLPPSRSNIRVGIQTEVRESESLIKSLTINQIRQSKYYLLSQSLRQVEEQIAKYIDEISDADEICGESIDPIQHLIALIMIPGKFAIEVPLDLLSRSLNKFGYVQLFDIFERVDIFQCYEDNTGNFFIGPRHPLEAKIYCQQKFGGARTEIEYARELIESIQSDDFSNGNLEIFFVVNLAHQIGPNGPEGYYYLDYYLDIANSLNKLRKDKQIFSPELILQEATLQREYVRKKIASNITPPNAARILSDVKDLLSSTIRRLRNERRSINYQNLLLVELANVQGTLANYSADYSIESYDILTIYREAYDNLNKVLSWATNDEHALDTLGWISRDLITRKVFDAQEEAEIISNVLSAIDTAESGGFDVSSKVLRRKLQILDLIGKEILADDVFNSLTSQGSCAGYHLRALYPIVNIPNNREYTDEERDLFKSTYSYLEENRSTIKRDDKCLRLLLYSWWKMRTGKPLFLKERQVLNFTMEDWLYVQGILQDLDNLGKLEGNPSLMYIYGITTFHLNNITESKRIFADIDRATYDVRGIRRLAKSYLASAPEGKPLKYYGDVEWIDSDRNIGEVYIPYLRNKITFFPRDFHQSRLKKGDSIGEFHIGFNFIGPIADPVSYTKQM